ncbi:hypothetical protein C2W62_16360, partial [Candidatus Entotheonella serta]
MLPDERGLLFLGHAPTSLTLLLRLLTRSTPTLLTPFIALAFQTVLDGTNAIENQFVNLLDDMKDTELMLDT